MKSKSVSKPKLKLKEATKSPNLIHDITGMSLSNPNPFEAKLKRLDPKLFKYDLGGKFTAYSRTCPSTVRRQPVILTDEEKERIDREHPGSYQHAIKYGSSPDKQYWYICPRYWNLKTNTSLTEEEVKSGNYGNKIPLDAKKVGAGQEIFEFWHTKEHKGKKDGEYIQHYPGFIKSDSHPDKLCLPCCFKQWDSDEQKQRRQLCSRHEEDEPVPSFLKDTTDEYIKGFR